MKFVEPSHFTDPDAAARKLVEIGQCDLRRSRTGAIYIELVNGAFLLEGKETVIRFP